MSGPSIEQSFHLVLRGLGRLDLVSSDIRSFSLAEHRRLEHNRAAFIASGKAGMKITGHSMSYRDIRTNAPIFYDFAEQGFDEIQADLITYRNKQYQWILVEAFEFLEAFIDDCYRVCEPRLSADQIPRDKRSLSAKLNALRSFVPSMESAETRNARGMNYRSAVALIELLRHQIVHCGGRIKDETEFFYKLRSLVQKNNSGAHDPEMEKDSRHFLFKGARGVEVDLLEQPDKVSSPMHTDRLGTLLGWLLSYSDCLKRELLVVLA